MRNDNHENNEKEKKDKTKSAAKENLNEGHRQRQKDKFLENGLEGFADYEILEFLLFYALPLRDTKDTAKRLLNTFDSLSAVLDAPIDLLCTVKGVGLKSATLIKFSAGLIKAYMEDSALRAIDGGYGKSAFKTGKRPNVIKTYEQAKQYMRNKFIGNQKECIIMAFLGSNGKVLYSKKLAEGSPDTVSIIPADIIRAALSSNAVKAVMAHNHPNGISIPSSQDLRTTSIIYDELHRVGVELMDHIIVAPNESPDDVYSMQEHGMFPAIKY